MSNQIITTTYTPEELTTLISDCIKKEFQNFTPPHPREDELITRKEAIELLKVSYVTLGEWTEKGLIKGYKIGTRVRYRKDELLSSLLSVRKYGRKEK